MEITDELYADLSKRIKAGEFLKKGATFASLPSFSEGASSASLPSLPEGADERMQSFYEDCQASRALDEKKIKALENEIQALKDEAKARMVRNDANEAIAEFNSALETDYDNYKAESEKTIATLKEALDDARKLSTDALDRNKKLLKEIERLRAKNETLSSFEAISYKRMPPPVHEESGKDDGSKAKAKIAKKIIKAGVDYASDIAKVKTPEDGHMCMRLLDYMLEEGVKKELSHDKDTQYELGNMILGIIPNRDRAIEEMNARKVENEARVVVSNGGIYNNEVNNQHVVPQNTGNVLPGEGMQQNKLEDMPQNNWGGDQQ